jgi:hypothetical protein
VNILLGNYLNSPYIILYYKRGWIIRGWKMLSSLFSVLKFAKEARNIKCMHRQVYTMFMELRNFLEGCLVDERLNLRKQGRRSLDCDASRVYMPIECSLVETGTEGFRCNHCVMPGSYFPATPQTARGVDSDDHECLTGYSVLNRMQPICRNCFSCQISDLGCRRQAVAD